MRVYVAIVLVGGSLVACAAPGPTSKVIPSKLYAESVEKSRIVEGVQGGMRLEGAPERSKSDGTLLPLGRFTSLDASARGRVHLASDDLPPDFSGPGRGMLSDQLPQHRTHSLTPELPPPQVQRRDGYTMMEERSDFTRAYAGPLHVGEPGVTSSLWREGRGSNDLWRDVRAWQPMDLITIIVREQSEGRKMADTEVKQKSTLALAIEKLFGLENAVKAGNDGITSGIDPTALARATSQNDFKGEGRTNRRDSLTASISAMVAEVLPSGILRIEGQKIISVNSEEQIMVISGLVRPRDISSTNEVESTRIANMRIDYYGNGTVDEAQHGGWLGRLLRTLWPF